MTDQALLDLAAVAGVAARWKDVFGTWHDVAPPTLRAVLNALGLRAESDTDIADSLARAAGKRDTVPPLVTAEQGRSVNLPCSPARYDLTLDDGRRFSGHAEPCSHGCCIPAILELGYHQLVIGEARTIVAVAPLRCFTVPEAVSTAKAWGVAVQLYGLRRPGDAGIGDFSALADLASKLAGLGAHAIGISPVHAQFSADVNRFSPYAPSSRTALNVLHAAIDRPCPPLEALPFVDWPAASRFRLDRFRDVFAASASDKAEQTAFAAFRQSQGERLQAHALFEALHAYFFAADPEQWHWRRWPPAFKDPTSAAVAQFAADHAGEVDFHAWLQFRADSGLAAAQAACRDAGMGIGLVSDLAVGADSGGSQCWSRQQETLLGLTVGAPPDLMQHQGQNWGLTAFSPPGLVANGYATYRDMLQTAMAHAGGMRIDHAMGLNRLWVIPDGATGADGAYLSFPERDLLRLITLESHRHRAVVLAEDLGTVPDGFQERLSEAGIAGMRVLWFERDKTDAFVSPEHWTQRAVAMTSTHDLPTVAGWWSGRDIEWQEKLHPSADAQASRDERAKDRLHLWQALTASGAAQGEAPAAEEPGRVVDAACLHIGQSACEFVMLPIEDALGLVEQPNLPGTLHEHPNWQRRLPPDPFDADSIDRMKSLDRARGA